MGKGMENYIGVVVGKINHGIRVWHDNNLKKHGVTLSQAKVLSCLWEENGLTHSEVQQKLNIKPSSLSGLVETLLGKGLVEQLEDESDARVKRIYLTQKSRDLQFEVDEEILCFEQKLKDGFTPEEEALLLQWLKRIWNNIQRETE